MNPPRAPHALRARIADFLRRFPPFSYIPDPALLALSGSVTVRYAPTQTTLFSQGERPHASFYVVREGALRLYRADDGPRLIDQLDEGDVFGMRPLIAKQRYSVTAVTTEESLLYVIELAAFEPLIDLYPQVARFLATSFAAGVRNPTRAASPGRVLADVDANEAAHRTHGRQREQLIDLSRVEVHRKPVTLKPGKSIQEAALKMARYEVGSIVIVDAKQRPIGIVTDRDLRRKVVTGLYSGQERVTEIMSAPVHTVAPNLRLAELQLAMVRFRVHHLVVTEDGTDGSETLGVLGNRDILLAIGNSPAAIVAELDNARTASELAGLRLRAERWLFPIIDQRGSTFFASGVMTEINDSITRRSITLALEDMATEGIPGPPLAFTWLALGSQARGEQLLRTDQDHAILIADGPPADAAASKRFYVELARRTSGTLAELGYDECVGDMMGSNPTWCQPLSVWKAHLDDWLAEPRSENLLFASTFFDRRPVFGDLELGTELMAHSRDRVQGEHRFLGFLAQAALDNPPPLSFFRSFVVERSGEHEDQFDIKQRAMLPLADAARVLSLERGVPDPSNTVQRFDRLRELEPQNANLYREAAQAYDTLMLFRARQGYSDGTDGRYFKIGELSKLERLQLRNTFRPIESLLAALRVRFQLSLLSS